MALPSRAPSIARRRTPAPVAPPRTAPVERAAVTFVVTTGGGAMAAYSQELGRRLAMPLLETDVYSRSAKLRSRALLGPAAARALLEDADFVRELRRLGTAVHLPNQHLARYGPFAGGTYLVTVHDVIRFLDRRGGEPLIHRPNLHDRVQLELDLRGISRAEAVITPSAATRDDVIRNLGVSRERVFVVHNGIDLERFQPTVGRDLGRPYLLFVGSEHRRKNLGGALQAFALLRRERRLRDLALVKVGEPGGDEAPFRERTQRLLRELRLEEHVIFTGRVEGEEMPAWYAGAECLVYPSLYEGFGFPPLEAMACGCPTVVSSCPALVEVAGPAAVTCDPWDPCSIADAITTIVEDRSAAKELRARGLAHARRFSWDRAASQTRSIYRRLGLLAPAEAPPLVADRAA